jgi:hypothetical protein
MTDLVLSNCVRCQDVPLCRKAYRHGQAAFRTISNANDKNVNVKLLLIVSIP